MTREAIRKKIIHWCLCHVLLMIIFISHIRNLAIIQPSRGWKEKWYRLLEIYEDGGQPTKMDNTAGFCQTNCRISLPIGLLPFQRQDMESMVYYRYTRQQWSMEISRITRINPRGIRFCLSLSLHFNRDKKTKSIPICLYNFWEQQYEKLDRIKFQRLRDRRYEETASDRIHTAYKPQETD